MKFGILTQWFDPEPGGGAISGALARELSRRGHEITVLTGFPNYPSGTIYPDFSMRRIEKSLQDDVRICRVALYPSHNQSTVHRLLNYGSFALSATSSVWSTLRNLDALWVYNSPASIALPMWTAKYLLGIPHVLHIMDLWPDSIYLSNFGDKKRIPAPFTWGLEKWCQGMYRSASSIAYVSEGMGRELAQRGVDASKLNYVPVWADEMVATTTEPVARATWGVNDDELLILYAGALGASQGLEALLDALMLIRQRVKVTCLIAGSGTAENALRERVRSLGLDNVYFLGQVPQSEMGSIARAADLHVVTLRDFPLSGITMPSKIQTTLACGKPFIAAIPGDARRASALSGAALLANPGDAQSIASALLQAVEMGPEKLAEMGKVGIRHYEQTFALGLGVDKLEALLIEAAREKVSSEFPK
jgi:glycosyltransferase involved in cell wall biosynthesis